MHPYQKTRRRSAQTRLSVDHVMHKHLVCKLPLGHGVLAKLHERFVASAHEHAGHARLGRRGVANGAIFLAMPLNLIVESVPPPILGLAHGVAQGQLLTHRLRLALVLEVAKACSSASISDHTRATNATMEKKNLQHADIVASMADTSSSCNTASSRMRFIFALWSFPPGFCLHHSHTFFFAEPRRACAPCSRRNDDKRIRATRETRLRNGARLASVRRYGLVARPKCKLLFFFFNERWRALPMILPKYDAWLMKHNEL